MADDAAFPLGHNGGPPLEVIWDRPALYDKQRKALFDCPDVNGNEARYGICEASAQPLDTISQTPQGPRPFGSLRVGDPIFGADGQLTKVTGVFPLGLRDVYQITFKDGAVTRACGEHLWEIKVAGRAEARVVSTDWIRARTPAMRNQLRFPVVEPAKCPEKPCPLSPWLVGALIGDGSVGQANVISFATADVEMADRVRAEIPKGYKLTKCSQYGYNIAACVRGSGYAKPSIRFKSNGWEVYVARKYVGRRATRDAALRLHADEMCKHYGEENIPEIDIRDALVKLGLLGCLAHTKRVPESLRLGSVAQRLEVLQGITDTDGSPSGYGAVVEQTSEGLSKDIEEIVRSLGGFAKTKVYPGRTGKCRTSYKTSLRLPNPQDTFWLERKRSRMKVRPYPLVRSLQSIEYIGQDDVQCISVSDSRSLYATDNYILTHNTKAGKTTACMAWLAERAWLGGGMGRNYWWVAPVYGQARIAFVRMKRALTRGSFRADNQALTITLQNGTLADPFGDGAVIVFKSGEKSDNLYGEDVYAAVIDEASRMREESWHAIRSTLTATRGPVRIIGNVKGRKNWFYKIARTAQSGTPGFSYEKLTAYDAIAGGVLDPQEIKDAQAVLPEDVFRELYLAEPADDEGNPFGYSHIAACAGLLSDEPVFCAGVDLAKRRDWTVVVGLDRKGNVCGYDRWQRTPWGETMERIKRDLGDVPVLVDATGVGDPIVESLQKTQYFVEGFVFTSKSKQMLMEGLTLDLQSRVFTYPSEAALPGNQFKHELDAFEYVSTRTGVLYSAPNGMHDDVVMALALARSKYRTLATPGAGNIDPLANMRISPWLGIGAEDAGDGYDDGDDPDLDPSEYA